MDPFQQLNMKSWGVFRDQEFLWGVPTTRGLGLRACIEGLRVQGL